MYLHFGCVPWLVGGVLGTGISQESFIQGLRWRPFRECDPAGQCTEACMDLGQQTSTRWTEWMPWNTWNGRFQWTVEGLFALPMFCVPSIPWQIPQGPPTTDDGLAKFEFRPYLVIPDRHTPLGFLHFCNLSPSVNHLTCDSRSRPQRRQSSPSRSRICPNRPVPGNYSVC